MQLFYSPFLKNGDKQHSLDKDESRHIVNVLRKKAGDDILITNGQGWTFSGQIISADNKNCMVDITSSEYQQKHPYHLHMYVAPTKMNDRFEWFLEKATEIGIDEITPIFTENSERRKINKDRYRRVILSAVKQSLKAHLPILNEAVNFKDLISVLNDTYYIAHCGDSKKVNLKEVLKPRNSYNFLIGPEGDFSENEINLALEQNVNPISLGSSRLRTETAGIYICNALAFINEV